MYHGFFVYNVLVLFVQEAEAGLSFIIGRTDSVDKQTRLCISPHDQAAVSSLADD